MHFTMRYLLLIMHRERIHLSSAFLKPVQPVRGQLQSVDQSARCVRKCVPGDDCRTMPLRCHCDRHLLLPTPHLRRGIKTAWSRSRDVDTGGMSSMLAEPNVPSAKLETSTTTRPPLRAHRRVVDLYLPRAHFRCIGEKNDDANHRAHCRKWHRISGPRSPCYYCAVVDARLLPHHHHHPPMIAR